MKIDDAGAIDLLKTHYDHRKEESERDFCRKFTFGYWSLGNSVYDLMTMLTVEKPKLFESFAEIAQALVEMLEGDDDSIDDYIVLVMDAYDHLEETRNNTIIG